MPTIQAPLPAPVGGINAVVAATAMPETDALTLVNMIGGRLGVTSRLGYQNHATGLGAEVRTVIPFAGGTAPQDRLFATTSAGIFDVSTGTPVSKLTFSDNGDDAGWGTFTSYVTVGGHFLLYADEANGLFLYNGTADTWSRVAGETVAGGGSRYYIRNQGAPSGAPSSEQGAGTSVTLPDVYRMDTTPGTGVGAYITSLPVGPGTYRACPLIGVVNLPSNMKKIRAQQWRVFTGEQVSATTSQFCANLAHVYVWRPGVGKIGTIIDASNSATALGGSPAPGAATIYSTIYDFAGAEVSNLQAGDQLVWEVWSTYTKSGTTNDYLYFDGTAMATTENASLGSSRPATYIQALGQDFAADSGDAQITGADPADFVFVTAWKNRLWFVKRDTGDAYFLPVGQFAGAVQRQSFGNKFRMGGYLVGLWSWTRDGGNGVDDFLVAVSSAGDVLVYQGSDPAVAGAFELTGDWNVGAVPAGRRICTDFGGDLLVLSTLGIVPMSKIITGTIGPDQYTTQKIQPLFNAYAADRGALRGWSLRLHPEDNALVVNMPLLGSRYEQLAMSLATGGWSVLSGVPSISSEVWQGKFYFGTPDGRVCVAAGGEDDGIPVEWSGQTAFQAAGSLQRKRIHGIQPLLVSQGAKPGIEVQARYDFSTDLVSATPATPDTTALAKWGTARWNQARWVGGARAPGEGTRLAPWRGATGNGYYASVAFRGRSSARTTLMGFNVRFDTGGIL